MSADQTTQCRSLSGMVHERFICPQTPESPFRGIIWWLMAGLSLMVSAGLYVDRSPTVRLPSTLLRRSLDALCESPFHLLLFLAYLLRRRFAQYLVCCDITSLTQWIQTIVPPSRCRRVARGGLECLVRAQSRTSTGSWPVSMNAREIVLVPPLLRVSAHRQSLVPHTETSAVDSCPSVHVSLSYHARNRSSSTK